jgi:hypothetical protein
MMLEAHREEFKQVIPNPPARVVGICISFFAILKRAFAALLESFRY